MMREKWIDWMRGIAISAVVVDHIFFIYFQMRIDFVWQLLYFSITWFVFLSGVTAYISFSRKDFHLTFRSLLGYWGRRMSDLVLPYIIVSGMVYFFGHADTFDIKDFSSQELLFSIQPTYYFVNLMLQLSVIAPFLYILLRFFQQKMRIIFVFFILFLSIVIFPLYSPPWPFSPTGRAFGGLYLGVYLMGFLFSILKFRLRRYQIVLISLLFGGYWVFLLERKISFLSIFASLSLVIWSLSFAVLTAVFFRNIKFSGLFSNILSILGRHSYFIYLSHFFILVRLSSISFFQTIPGGFCAFFVSIGISLLIDYIYTSFLYSIKIIFRRRNCIIKIWQR